MKPECLEGDKAKAGVGTSWELPYHCLLLYMFETFHSIFFKLKHGFTEQAPLQSNLLTGSSHLHFQPLLSSPCSSSGLSARGLGRGFNVSQGLTWAPCPLLGGTLISIPGAPVRPDPPSVSAGLPRPHGASLPCLSVCFWRLLLPPIGTRAFCRLLG